VSRTLQRQCLLPQLLGVVPRRGDADHRRFELGLKRGSTTLKL
jgi:hypothetical protein